MHKEEKRKLNIGKVIGAVGLKGEMKIFHHADDPALLMSCKTLWVGASEYDVINLRYKKKIPILRLDGIEDRNAAENLIGSEIYIFDHGAADLPSDTYYVDDLRNLDVVSVSDGGKIGVIHNVITGTSQDVYEIETDDGKKMLLPAVTDFIVEIKPENGYISVRLPAGIEDIKY